MLNRTDTRQAHLSSSCGTYTRKGGRRARKARADPRPRRRGSRQRGILPYDAAEDARHATIATVGATADALSTALAQMQFLEDARNTIRQLKIKPDYAQ